ncbi:immunoglobulin superfamily member 1-like [Mauremys reevesii]|uniref:immunoglobulin superfamily member 1-like n=1 Tax=Mauremys reevesii TaxID=260615 RepID=UPI00193FB8F1|nr:immunoglobulin superfamily member 1-like [Mauremys reevesii]
MEFFLHKTGHPNLEVQSVPDGPVAEFPIPSVSREDGGSYTCDYHSITDQSRWSYPSDPVEIIVAGLLPNIPALTLVLIPLRELTQLGPSSRIPHSRSRSEKALMDTGSISTGGTDLIQPGAVLDPTHLGSKGPGREYPKPTIWVSPSRVVALGRSVTIRCEGLYPGMQFFLRKAGHPNLQVWTVPDGPVAEFPIPSVSREDGGSYTCEYRSITEPSRWSHLSDSVEIIHQGVWFVLNKEGRHFPPVDSDGLEAEFPISNIHRDLGGSYSCSYHSKSEPFNVSDPSDPVELVEPFISSQPSDPVQLVVAEPSLPKPSISVRPTRGVTLGGPATILCRARSQNATFLLYKDGRYWGRMAPAGDMAEFPVAGARWEDAGSYSCSYHTTREPVAVSHPSDPTRLVVRDYTQGNIVRLALSTGVLLALALILAEAAHGWRRGRR